MFGKLVGLVGAAVFVAAAFVEVTDRWVRRKKSPTTEDGEALDPPVAKPPIEPVGEGGGAGGA